MASSLSFTSPDLFEMPEGLWRYEIIDGELWVSRWPSVLHQATCGAFAGVIFDWQDRTGLGIPLFSPGLVLSKYDDCVPDVVWIEQSRFEQSLDERGHFRVPPDLIIEVLSPGRMNERRDQEAKLKMYARYGLKEYWIADWRDNSVSIYQHDGSALKFRRAVSGTDVLTSFVLPGFSVPVDRVFDRVKDLRR